MTRTMKVTVILATALVCGASAMPHAAPAEVPRPPVPVTSRLPPSLSPT